MTIAISSFCKPKTISLCSGFGLLDYAARDAGFDIAVQCESEPYQRKLLSLAFPNTKQHSDIFALDKKWMEDERIDTTETTFLGGLCCKPFSNMGGAKGENSEHYMVYKIVFLVRTCRPRFVLVENVYNFLSHKHGFDRLRSLMARENYKAWPLVLPASAFGAPHERYRTFVLFTRDSFVLSNPPSYGWQLRHSTPPTGLLSSIPGIWNGRSILEPGIPRMAYGHPTVDDIKRLECAGNAVVYDVAYYVCTHVNTIHDYFYGEGTPWAALSVLVLELFQNNIAIIKFCKDIGCLRSFELN